MRYFRFLWFKVSFFLDCDTIINVVSFEFSKSRIGSWFVGVETPDFKRIVHVDLWQTESVLLNQFLSFLIFYSDGSTY